MIVRWGDLKGSVIRHASEQKKGRERKERDRDRVTERQTERSSRCGLLPHRKTL